MDRQEASRLIAEAAAHYQQEELDLLMELSSIDCGTGNLTGNTKIVAILKELLERSGVSVETIDSPSGTHIVARIVPEKPRGKIILNAHIDTAFKPGDVDRNPVRIENGWLHGCGTADCKGGVVISAYAVKICKELGLLPQYEICLIYNCDEEIGSPDGSKIFASEGKNATCVYAFEPSREEDGILTGRQGSGTARIECFGKQSHAALFKDGHSATECLVKVLNKLYSFNAPEKNLYFNAGDFTIAASVNTLSPYSSARISFRINDENPFAQSAALLKSLEQDVPVEGCSVKVEVNEFFPLMKRTPENIRLYKHMRELGKEFMDWDLPEQTTFGSGDACYFAKMGVPAVCGLGTYLHGVHTLEERCRIDSLQRRTQLMALTLAQFDASVLGV